VYAVSATMREIIEPLAELLGLDGAVASEMQVVDGCYTGELGVVCHGQGKADRLREFALEHDLLEAIDPVQYTLRLLLPPGSLLLEGAGRWLRDFDAEAFSWRWEHEDRRVDALCRDSVAAVQAGAGFDELRALADRAAGRPGKSRAARSGRSVPRLTEPWFC